MIGQNSEKGTPVEPSQTLWCTSHPAGLDPRLAVGNQGVLSAQCRAAALGIVCTARSGSFPPCWEAEVLPHHRDIYTASALREMSMPLWIVENTLENLCLSRNGLATGLIAWESGSQTGLLILLKSHPRSQHILSHVSGRMWDPLTRAQIGTFWHSGVMLWL